MDNISKNNSTYYCFRFNWNKCSIV